MEDAFIGGAVCYLLAGLLHAMSAAPGVFACERKNFGGRWMPPLLFLCVIVAGWPWFVVDGVRVVHDEEDDDGPGGQRPSGGGA